MQLEQRSTNGRLILEVWRYFQQTAEYHHLFQWWYVSGHILWITSWWRHQMETVSALLAICAGNSPVPGEVPAQRPVTRGFDVFYDLRPDKQLSKQSWGWWFETPSHSLWRHRNGSGALLWNCSQQNTFDNKSTISMQNSFHDFFIERWDSKRNVHKILITTEGANPFHSQCWQRDSVKFIWDKFHTKCSNPYLISDTCSEIAYLKLLYFPGETWLMLCEYESVGGLHKRSCGAKRQWRECVIDLTLKRLGHLKKKCNFIS